MNDDQTDPLEHRLRAWAEAGIRDAPDVALPDRSPTAGRLFTVLAVAASVVALIVGISVVSTRDGAPVVAPPAVATTSNAAPPPSRADTDEPSMAPDPTPATPSAPSTADVQTMQTVTFKQLQVEVPASWQIDAVTCGSAIADTVVLVQAFLACAHPRAEGVTVVQFRDLMGEGIADTLRGPGGIPSSIPGDRILDSVRFDGRLDEGEGVEVTTVVVQELGVSVQISSADRTTVERILATLRQVDVDAHGCRTADSAPVTSSPGSVDPAGLLPQDATDVVLCRYREGVLRRSVALEGEEITHLSQLLSTLSPGPVLTSSCSGTEPWVEGANHIRILADGHPAVIGLSGCQLFVGNDQGALTLSPELFTFLVDVVGFDGGLSPQLLVPPAPDPSPAPTS